MKAKKIISLAALILALCGCGTASAAGGQSVPGGFSMEKVAFDGDFDVYQDRETGVQYIVYREWKNAYATFCAMTPRYNADGSLYQGGVAHE